MRTVLVALLISTVPALGTRTLPVFSTATAGETDEDEFNVDDAIAAYKAEAAGCSGVDVDGSNLNPEIQDRRCAVMNSWRMMLEEHGYCIDSRKQEWTFCRTIR